MESPEGLLERVRAIAPLIESNAEEAERRRRPADEVIEALKATGVFRAFVPRRFGGYEIGLDTFIDVGLAVSRGCASTGWVTMFYMEHNWLLAQFGREAQEEIFGAQPYILAPASINPVGKAVAEPGGYRVSGRWPWSTGVMHADWVMLNGTVDIGAPIPMPCLFIVPASEIRIEDTWHASGMCGTGSNDIVAEGVFVPKHRSQDMMSMALGRGPGSKWLASPTYRMPMLPFLALTAGTPAIGAARRAVELFRDRLGHRVLFGSNRRQVDLGSAQAVLGAAEVRVQAAETLMRAVGRDLTAWGGREAVCPTEERARLKLHVAQVVRMCRDLVRDLLEAAGAGAHMSSHPLQRIGRDVEMLGSHIVFDWAIGSETYGRIRLGLEPKFLV